MSLNPILDFGEYGLDIRDISTVTEETLTKHGKSIIEKFKTFGYCSLTNHGIKQSLLDDYMRVSRTFFSQPLEEKANHALGHDCGFGWLKLEGERINRDRLAGDYKETFNYMPDSGYEGWWDIENFEELTKKFFDVGSALAYRFCDVLSLGLGLPKDFMRNAHSLVGRKGNSSQVRTLLYPPIGPEVEIKPDQVRLGEHIDYGSISFVFSNESGLEIRSPDGKFQPVEPIPGALIVLVGYAVQRWTSDHLIGSKHRILIPQDERRNMSRQSLVYFLVPDNDLVIKCLDGSNKYKPMTSRQFVDDKLENQYT